MPSNDALTLAKRHLMDLLAQREHTEAELRSKLQRFLGDDSEASTVIAEALQFAKEKRWLRDPVEISAEVSGRLHQKNKGIEYINTYLEGKGLPTIEQDSELELEKARTLVKNKYSDISEVPPEERPRLQARVARLLASRGFDSDVVRKVLYEKFGD